MRRYISLLLGLTLAISVSAKINSQFIHYEMNDGLSRNMVAAITQDQMGFMWFGTRNGLNRFDGHNFKIYYRSEGGLEGNDISSLLTTADGSLWIGGGTGLYKYDFSNESFKRIVTKASDGVEIRSNVNQICALGNDLVIVTDRQGLFFYDTAEEKLTHNSFQNHLNITAVTCDAKQRIWLGFYGSGLYYVDKSLKNEKKLIMPADAQHIEGVPIRGIIATEQNQLIIGTEGKGVFMLNLNTMAVTSLFDDMSDKGKVVHTLARRENDIIVATEDGIYVYEMLTHNTSHYQHEPSNPMSLADNSIQSLYCDNKGGIWIGTYFGGVCYSPYKMMLFDGFFPRMDVSNSIHGRRVREIVEDNQGYIWIGTEDGGLNRFNPATGEFNFFKESSVFSNIHGLCVVGDKLWVGTYSNGVVIIDTRTLKITQTITAHAGREHSLLDNDIFAIEKTHDGNIYLGTLGGLCRYLSNDEVQYIDEVPHSIIYDIHEDRAGNLWAVIYGNSLICRKASSGKWVSYSTANSKLPAMNVLNVEELSDGTILLTTDDSGILRYNAEKDVFEQYVVKALAPNTATYCVIEDNSNKWWISTSHGLVWFDPETKESHAYTTANGLIDNNFNYKSALLSQDGRMYMGCLKGIVSFYPAQFQDITVTPRIVATELYINNTAVRQYGNASPLAKSIVLTDKLSLAHSENSFAIQVASLLYGNDEQVQMEYMLSGFDKNWMPVPADNIISFINVPDGKYKLCVRASASSNDIDGKQFEMEITIRPPFYRSWWAYLLYSLCAIALLYFIVRIFQNRDRELRENAMQKFEYEKEQELYQSKINFFTNVAHEIRTPLTLIKAPLEKLLKRKDMEPTAKEDLGIMHKNVSRLLDLTNQLLDFRRAERDSLRLNIERCNITQIIESVYVRFSSLMREKGIDSQYVHPDEPFYAFIDKEGFTKIVSNMLNNAVKYCEHYIKLDLRAKENDEIQLILSNDGPLVPQKLRDSIFEPFDRGSSKTSTTPGTGIGLALARALAELHEGTLKMQDDPQLNVFVLTLPVQKLSSAIELHKVQEESGSQRKDNTRTDDTDLPVILIVEDNVEMLNYEHSQLEDDYNVLTASNGEEALRVLADHDDVALIVSDVMMEPMGGFELCRTVKNDVNFSHIPVILLTALTLDSAKVEGMESGADSYIEKPFSMDYLRSSIKNLLRQRQTAKAAYANSPFLPSDTLTISNADDEFIKKLEEVITRNMSNSEFSINDLAQEMCMSRTGLNRKLRGIFNMSPNNYIKVSRLKYAALLMKNSNMRVSEVCYNVGFTSPSYFTQCFYKQFGLLPRDFQDSANSKE
ncbi:MAG: response regulator [Prevotella sp.]|nr:response regulator [Prevotella sp.]